MPEEIIDDPQALAERLSSIQGLIAFDGCPTAGKTYLARDVAARLGCDAIDVDEYIHRDHGIFVDALRVDDLVAAITAALSKSPLTIMSGICARAVVERLGLQAMFVYVQRSSSTGIPGDLDTLDAEEDGADVSHARDLPPPHGEVLEYHARYKPRRWADIVYIRTAD
jgi:hypothetical protein